MRRAAVIGKNEISYPKDQSSKGNFLSAILPIPRVMHRTQVIHSFPPAIPKTPRFFRNQMNNVATKEEEEEARALP